ncbi:MAG: type II CAAX endopeptidase family protein [Bacillota bacterium]|nr:type II CAAX endopeptidase family protein [Bacillota bacterium]
MKRILSVLEVNLLFIVLCALLLTVGAIMQSLHIIGGLLFTEFGLILGVSLLFLKIRGGSIRDTLRLHPVKPMMLFKVVLVALLMVPVVLFLNLIVLSLIQTFGRVVVPAIPTATDVPSLFVMIFSIAVSAGICEEALFRGVMLRSYERDLGRKWAAVLSALLFGMFHFNLGNLLGPIALGLVYAYYVQLSGSIYPAMLGHFVNNGTAVLVSYLASNSRDEALRMLEGGLPEGLNAADALADVSIIQMLIPFLLPALVGAAGAFFLIRSMRNQYPKRRSDLYEGEIDERLNYTTTHYRLWGPQPVRVRLSLVLPVILIVVAYIVLTYLTFFR